MITSVTAENSSNYSALFRAATEFLLKNRNHFPHDGAGYEDRIDIINNMATIAPKTDPETGDVIIDEESGEPLEEYSDVQYISSIQEYFSHLKDFYDLKAYGGDVYIMLPLDEPYLEINANSRDIVIPAEFKKNGFGVEDDNTAENLIFKMPRFFDAMDLLNTIIRVQWINAKGEEGVSEIQIIDAKKNADYIYFMWPLTTEVTDYKGTISFSVRFYQLELGRVVYSYSTKIAKGVINEGHAFDMAGWTGTIDSADDDFRANIKNSQNVGVEAAAEPFFIIDLADHFQGNADENYDQIITDGEGRTTLECYLDDEHPNRILRVEAGAADTGYLKYEFIYTDETNLAQYPFGQQYSLEDVKDYEYFEIDRAAEPNPVQGKRYYKREGDNYVECGFDREVDTLYERTCIVNINKETNPSLHVVGQYAANVTNSKNGSQSTIESTNIRFPAPEVLEYAEDGNLEPYKFLNADHAGELSVDVNKDEFGAKLTYSWYKVSDLNLNYNASTLNNFEHVADTNEGILDVSGEPGYYTVVVKSTRNYVDKYIDSMEQKVCKVCDIPMAPIVTPAAGTGDVAVDTFEGDKVLEVRINLINNKLLSEKLTYQWYRTAHQVLIEGASGECALSEDGTCYVARMVVPRNAEGSYCCDIINTIGTGEYAQSTIVTSEDFMVGPGLNSDPVVPEPEPEPEEPTPTPEPEPDPEPTVDPDNPGNEEPNPDEPGNEGEGD